MSSESSNNQIQISGEKKNDVTNIDVIKLLHPNLITRKSQVHFLTENYEDSSTKNNDFDDRTPISHEKKKRSTIKKLRSTLRESAIEIIKPQYQNEFNKYLDKKVVKNDKKKRSCCASCSVSNLKQSRFISFTYFKNNKSFWILIIIYILLSILFILIQLLVLYPNAEWYVKLARAPGILINYNSCLVILLVLRRLTSWARNTVLGAKVNVLDDFIIFHKVIGVWIGILSIIHTIGQVFNMYYISVKYDDAPANATYEEQDRGTPAEVIFGTASRVGWVGAGASPTGWILVLVLIIMITFAMPFVRRNGYFQLFYITHWLHYVYYIVLFFHATNWWKWFIGPFVLVLIERIIKRFRLWSVNYGETYIRDVNLLSSKVTHLVIARPEGFKFQAGDYMFIKIAKIARNEWHPFTISSAPELKDELWVHIRSLGDWTNTLNEYFTNYESVINELIKQLVLPHREVANDSIKLNGLTKLSSQKVKAERTKSKYLVRPSFKSGKNVEDEKNTNLNMRNKIMNVNLEIQLDGPYGTASRRIFDSEHAVLFAAGIGVTPFASILQSLCIQYLNCSKTCERCNYQWYEDLNTKTLRRVDFFWVNRDFEAFEWFVELLSEIERQQRKMSQEPLIRINLYMTSAKVEQELKVINQTRELSLDNVNLEKEIVEEKHEDFSLKIMPGRPPLDKIFKVIQTAKKGKVDTFFCGAPIFGEQIRQKCVEYKFNFSQENF